jgi:heptosyltransferase-2
MMSPSEIRKILVIQTASIGDVILATSLLEKLHHHFPESKLDFLLKSGNERLFQGHPFLHRLFIWDKSEKKYRNLRILIRTIRSEQYDLVVNLQRFTSSGLMTILSGGRKTVGFKKNPLSLFFSLRIPHSIHIGNVHESERNQSLVDHLTDDSRFPVKLYPSVSDDALTSQYKTHRFITVSPASLWFTKQFPEEKWIRFLSQVDSSLYVYLLGSNKDKVLCERIVKESGHKNSLILAGKLSFLESASLMRDAYMNYTNDSAPLHLASSVNARTTAIFCSTVESFGFGPLSTDAKVIETPLELECRPCGLHGFKKCPEKHFKCALTINEKELLERLKQ